MDFLSLSDTMFLDIIIALIILFGVVSVLKLGIQVVPQSEVYVIERFGRFSRTLNPGLSLLIPFFDKVAHRVSVLERQLAEQRISVITKDNVEVKLETRVFFRVLDGSRSVYRIRNIDDALITASSSIVRSAAGKLELDELQSSREAMNAEIAENLKNAAEVWGIEITRTEITDVIIDEATKDAQRQQLNAERKRRATIAEAEGEKRSIELKAEADLFKAQKEAEAIKIKADADAYSIREQAKAEADQTKLLADAIAADGQSAIEFEIAKRRVDALGDLAAAENTKTLIMPTNVTEALGAATTFIEGISSIRKG